MGAMAESVTEHLVLTLVVLLAALTLRLLLTLLIKRLTKAIVAREPAEGEPNSKAVHLLARTGAINLQRQQQRVRTLGSLLRNVVNITIVVVGLLTIMAIWGVPMGPLIASAGVGGVALGFGAQSLVKDYLSGVFMLAEDQFGVGDLIKVGELTGTVQEVTLRVTKLRDPGGTVWYIRNGEVLTVGNISQGFSSSTIDVPVAIDEDPERVQRVLTEALAGMADEQQWQGVLLENPTVLGIGAMSGGTMTFQIGIKTGPDKQWGPMRAVRERAQRALTAAGVRAPIIQTSPPPA